MARRLALIVPALLAGACTASQEDVVLAFAPDPGPIGEAYLCFGYDATLLAGSDIGGFELSGPEGPITLHHVALFASSEPFADGPVECTAMPDTATPLQVWATGGAPLPLPPDVSLVVPDGTIRFVVQTHALRYGDGAPLEHRLVLHPREGALHRAGWLPLRAPTPALRPHHREESTAECRVAGALEVISTWPHMHKHGAEFTGTAHRDAGDDVFVSVLPWNFDAQRAYPLTLALAASDRIETNCVWTNDTDETVLPGPSIFDEMCGQSLMAWPYESAHCE